MSKTMQEMAEIRLEATKYLISTFRDLKDLEELKKWVDEEFENYQDLIKHVDKMRMLSLLYNKPELFEEWKRDNLMSPMGYETLNILRDQLFIKFCLVCGEPVKFRRSTRKYCGNTCLQAAYRKRKRLKKIDDKT